MAANKSERALVDEWRDVLAVHARTTCELDRALHPHGLGASDFEVLDVLAEGASEDGPVAWRVQELADRVHLSQSALSRLVARLEKDGLVARGMCPEDRRGVQVRLTERGSDRHAEVKPLQREVLTRMLDRSS
ncbi:MarR family winged helix-turn-helix transcriptional regulator [Streptomyces sp. NPDC088757]|uniref:MarR family winged helix-turn-helix transcriptional regulator n=1 Tax=Streptomyces sp. NPDC088757 TaxID=3365889 RepID=UPI0038069387